MSPLFETSLWLALKNRIETLPGTRDVAYPAGGYAPTPGTEFLAVGVTSAEPERLLIKAGPHRRRGTLTLTLVQALGQDSAYYIDQAAEIVAHFAEDTLLSYNGACVRITSRPHIADGYRDSGWWRTPVMIRWESMG